MRLDEPSLAAILAREHAAAEAQRTARRAAPGPQFSRSGADFRTSDRHRTSYLAIGPDQGRWLHGLVRALRPGRVVEFGTSFGISALYLASAAAESDAVFIGTEYHSRKAERARATLREAGLAADIRLGDARETLAEPGGNIDLLFLDGAKDLYRPILDMLEPWLDTGSVIVADNIALGRAETADFLARVEETSAYVTTRLTFDKGGMSFSVRL